MTDRDLSDTSPSTSFFDVSFNSETTGSGTTTAHGVRFSRRIGLPNADLTLRLCSSGLMRYKLLAKGFVAALYLESCELQPEALSDVAKRLELSYFWKIPGSLFGPAGRSALQRGLSRAELGALGDRLDRIERAYRSIEPGDRYALTYLPGHGTQLSLNTRHLELIEGSDFARAYFGIWLGKHAIDKPLRRRLLS